MGAPPRTWPDTEAGQCCAQSHTARGVPKVGNTCVGEVKSKGEDFKTWRR